VRRPFLAVLQLGGLLAGAVTRTTDVTPPKVLHRVDPRYTREARANGIQGTVLIEVAVDETGKPGEVSVLSPIGFGLDNRAIDAVRQWTFRPGARDGKPVASIATVEVKFRIFHRRFDPAADERRIAFNLAVDAIQRKRQTSDPPDAQTLGTMRKLAQQKYPPAMYLYGKLLEAGDGVAQNRDAALRLIAEAAEKAYPSAMFDIGRMMMEGRRLKKDPEKGLELVRNAAILGNRRAQFFLGVAYLSGYGVPQDAERAHQNFRLCAAVGETPCQVQLAKLLLQNATREERDFLQAIAWLELAAEDRNEEAKLILDQEHTELTPKQISWVNKLKSQLIQRQ
jgi:TonB family protein